MKKLEENQNRDEKMQKAIQVHEAEKRIKKIESAIELFKELKAENTQLFCIRDSANQAFMQDAVDGLTNLKNYLQKGNSRMAGRIYKIENSFGEAIKDGNRWTGDFEPEKGDKVLVDFNNLGTGIIEGFFSENSYIGVLVRPDKPPEWWRKQNPDSETYSLFGIEIKKA